MKPWRLGGRLPGAFMAAFLTLAVSDLVARGKWVTLENCTLIPNPSNDGDSFHVRVKRREYIFRLYFVDAPETDPSLADRLDEQAKYFGITVAQALQVGEIAKNFTAEKLLPPFAVRTCREDALGRSRLERFYAFVQTGNEDLAEELIRNGLARVHGTSGKPVGLLTADGEWAKLQQLQADARAEKVGGWGVNFGRTSVRSQKEGGKPYDPFDSFFHAATPRPAVSGQTTMARLDINSASAAELQDIPGIGPALAGRIIAARPFKSADDLRHVKGIGDAR
jgi:DNA uptake protein ComE-like DNA-binding protein